MTSNPASTSKAIPAMACKIPAGAYVIRNKKTSTVLHISDPDVRKSYSSVLCYEQDESQYQDQQIWWVEPLPEYVGNFGENAYSITNPASGRSLDMNASSGTHDGRVIGAYLHQGVPWQIWKFQPSRDNNGDFYNIVNVMNEQVLSMANDSSGASCQSKKKDPGNGAYFWELVIPAVAFPPGWVQIQNVRTGDLLSHTYLHNPPVLASPPDPAWPSQRRDGWKFQWSISHSKCSHPKSTAGRNSWCIVNRLTRGRLMNTPSTWNISGVPPSGVTAWHTAPTGNSTWKLELDQNCNWKIINLTTSFLLEHRRVPFLRGPEVACVDQSFALGEGTKSWVISPPPLDTHEVVLKPPPEYDSLAD